MDARVLSAAIEQTLIQNALLCDLLACRTIEAREIADDIADDDARRAAGMVREFLKRRAGEMDEKQSPRRPAQP